MDDIKQEFFRIARRDIEDKEPYLSNSETDNVINFRWDCFVKRFCEDKSVMNYALGKLY